MAINASFAAALCYVTVAPPPGTPIRADICKYRVQGAWVIGGDGDVAPPDLLRPVRVFAKDDTIIERPAAVKELCFLSRDADGTLKLYMLTEVFGDTDCEQP